MILADCIEQRTISSTVYNPRLQPPQTMIVTRHLQQAMVPGPHLVAVYIDRSTYQTYVEPVWKTARKVATPDAVKADSCVVDTLLTNQVRSLRI